MISAIGALLVALGGLAYSAGVIGADVSTIKENLRPGGDIGRRIAQLENEQGSVQGLQIESALQGATLESQAEDIEEIKEGQEELKIHVDQSRKENDANFRKLLEAVEK